MTASPVPHAPTWARMLKAMGLTRPRPAPGPLCPRCDGHRCIEVYDHSNEYAAPCPVCVGQAAFDRKVARMTGQ